MRQDRSQEGFSLIAVLGLALLAMFAAFAALRMFQQESKALVSTMNRDRLEQALDAGLDKAVFALNQPNAWNNLGTTAYFSSLTADATAFNDLNGVKYWVKVLPGRAAVPPSSNVFSLGVADTNADLLTKTGDTTFDRTVIIMARAISGTTAAGKAMNMGVSLTAMAYLHRNDVITLPEIGGIYAGSVGLGNSWNGNSYDSCAGTPVTSQTPGCDGSATGGTVGTPGGTWCLGLNPQPTFVPYPTPAVPVGTVPFPGNGSVSVDYDVPNTAASSRKLGPGPIKYQCVNLHALGSRDMIIDTSGSGPVELYVTGNMDWGTGNLTSPPQSPGGSPPEAIIYIVSAAGVTPTVDLNGSGNFECMIIAPKAAVTFSGGANFYGAVVAGTFSINGGGTGGLHFDKCILQGYKSNTYRTPPIVNAGWYQF